MNNRNQALDVLRAIAVLLVTGHHYHYYRWWSDIGGVGVDLFFVLSGYLISGLLFRDLQQTGEIHVGRFLIRRGFKIYPAYYAMVLCFLPFTAHTVTWADFAFMGAYYPVLWGHGWSLSVEEHFYLLLPLALMISRRWFRSQRFTWIPVVTPVLLIICLVLRWQYSAANNTNLGITQTHMRIDSLFAGVALGWANFFTKSQLKVSRAWAYWLLGALVLLPELSGRMSLFAMTSYGYTGLTVGFALILVAALNSPWLKSPVFRPLARLGVYSYSVYLWHLAIAKLFTFTVRVSFVHFWVYMVLCFAVGIWMAKLIEMPVLRVRDWMFPVAWVGGDGRTPAPHAELNPPYPQSQSNSVTVVTG